MVPSQTEVSTSRLSERLATLPSGRSISVRIGEAREAIEVRSPDGTIELEIALTDAGPVVRLRASKLELEAREEFAVRCRRFALQATEGAELSTEGTLRLGGQEMRVRTQDDIHMDGAFIRLNCDPGFPRPGLLPSPDPPLADNHGAGG